HAASRSRMTVEAATFALGAHPGIELPFGVRVDTTLLPVVGVVDRLRRIPVFDAISIDELFRIASAGQQVHYEPERHIGTAGTAVEAALFLLDGTVTDGAQSPVISAPAAIHFEEILEGRAARSTLTASAPAVCLRLESAAVMTMIADNVALAQGLFEMLLASH